MTKEEKEEVHAMGPGSQSAGGHSLRRLLERIEFQTDSEDLRRRVRGRVLRRRLTVAMLGLAVATAGLLPLALALNKRAAESDKGSGQPVGSSTAQPVSDMLLVQEGLTTFLVSPQNGTSTHVAEGFNSYALSPDAGSIVATRGREEKGGNYRQFEILVIDVRTKRSSVVFEAGPKEGFTGPFDWSRDGSRVAFVRAEWTVDPTQQHPGEPATESACVLSVGAGDVRCFPGPNPITSLEFSPDGSRLLIGGPGVGLQELSLETSMRSELVPPNGGPGVQDALHRVGLGSDPVQFVEATWSASGQYFAAVAEVGWFVPLVMERGGGVLAVGHPTPDLPSLEWSPTKDVLAYSVGRVGPPQNGDPPHAVRLLNPLTGEDTIVLSTEDVPNVPGTSDPFILLLVWSPDGQMIAAGGRDQIWIFDPADAASPRTIKLDAGTHGELLDWEG